MKKSLIRILDYLFLLRIPLLAPVWTVLILGWLTATSGNRPGGLLLAEPGSGAGWVSKWIILLGFSLVVAHIYVVNQIADRESDRINNKLFFLPRGIISVPGAWSTAAVCLILGLGVGFYYGPVLFVLFVASALLGLLYNLGPFALKNRPWGGMLANLVGHGMLTYLVGWYAACFGLSWSALMSSLAPGFANAAVYLVSTVADETGDRATGKTTFCVRYGQHATFYAALVCCLAALGCTPLIAHNRLLMYLPAGASTIFFAHAALRPGVGAAHSAFKWPVLLLAVMVAIMEPLYGVLIAVTFWSSRWYYGMRFNLRYPSLGAQ